MVPQPCDTRHRRDNLGNSKAYRYLPDSIQDFLHPDDLAALFEKAGLQSVRAFPLTFGLTYLHEGCVP